MTLEDQQYCLRWNNHQSTLISVIDSLLASESLTDCTIAAEGKIFKAHKVVLSACSPYFATLMQEQYDKHPVFILKDVKFQELRAMMDYMYRGEVNISQDQLSALLRAAESLQIKGLSDGRLGGTSPLAQQLNRGKLGAGYTLEQTKRARMAMDVPQDVSREGSSSPTRRRRKARRRSNENVVDAHDNSNSSMIQIAAASNLSILQQTNAASALVATQMPIIGTTGTTITANQGTIQQQPLTTTINVTKKTESAKGTSTSLSTVAAAAASVQQQQTTSDAMNTENVQIASSIGQGSGAVIVGVDDQIAGGDQKSNHHKQQKLSKEASTSSAAAAAAAAAAAGELVIEPKSEYDDEGHEETVEDLTLDDEEIGMEELDQTAGTSQGGEGSSQGYAAWQHDRSQEELLLATQDAQQRDPQGLIAAALQLNQVFGGLNQEENANSAYVRQRNDDLIEEDENGRFPCKKCTKSYLRKRHLQRHKRDECIGIPPRFSCELCPSRFRRKYHMVRHLISKHEVPMELAQQASSGNGSRTNNRSSSNFSIAAAASAAGITLANVVNNVFRGFNQDLNIGGGGGGTTSAMAALSAVAAAANGFNGVGGSSSCASFDNASVGSAGSNHGGISPLPENLSMRMDHYNYGNLSTSPSLYANVCTSPLPPHMMPIPTYRLTGAISAISAAAAIVEEQAAAAAAAAIVEEQAAAAAAAAATASNGLMNNNNHEHENNDEDYSVRGDPAMLLECHLGGENENVNDMRIESEQGPSSSNGQQNRLEEEWRMKLGLQIITNSILKERLMKSMPFASNKNK